MSADRMPTSRGIAPLADIPDREGGDGGPELVIRGEHPVIPVPMLPRPGHEVSEPVDGGDTGGEGVADSVGVQAASVSTLPGSLLRRIVCSSTLLPALSTLMPTSLPSAS